MLIPFYGIIGATKKIQASRVSIKGASNTPFSTLKYKGFSKFIKGNLSCHFLIKEMFVETRWIDNTSVKCDF